MTLAIAILLTHLAIGAVFLYAMTHDIGALHKHYLTRLTRATLIGWWLMQLEHTLRSSHFDLRQLLSEILLLASVCLMALSLASIKKLIK